MNEFVWKNPDFQAMAAPSQHWQRNRSMDSEPGPDPLRVGHSFARVGVQQSVAPQLQAKLSVSHPSDSAELEADRVAEAVMSMPDPQPAVSRAEDTTLQRMCPACAEEKDAKIDGKAAAAVTPEEVEKKTAATKPEEEELSRAEDEEDIQRKADDEEDIQRKADNEEDIQLKADDEEDIQRKADDEEKDLQLKADDEELDLQAKSHGGNVPQVTPELESDIQSVHSAGAPLAKNTRDFFEPRLGADLSNVRVHTGSQASHVSRQLNARAFTVGSNITFADGQYQPSSNDGKRLLAHELTHVIQQGGAAPNSTDGQERE